ncbi:transglycosylase domain-containing protein [Hydrogenophaga sp.]|uniref:transglycosylase domain-containing protein n=2 Tax=Hydrogenophaga sp. TaxID=1904254 RepID=UPI002D1FAEA7|nr:transglycosylase domain-containing protein [Hydrogenophaga sp.]
MDPGRQQGGIAEDRLPAQRTGRSARWLRRLLLSLVLLLGLAAWLAWELRSSQLQARWLTQHARSLTYNLHPGPAEGFVVPTHGPFNQRLGYTQLPLFTERLQARGLEITRQAAPEPALRRHFERGLSNPFPEKVHSGLTVYDCRRETVYAFRYPHRQFQRFEDIPPVVVQALLFIENRDLLDAERPMLNPAVDWVRFTRAVLGQLGNRLDLDLDTPGGSTLATQIEKYRHSPGGVTHEPREKLRQMVSAAIRAYRQGEHNLPVRRQIVLDYLNSVPLAAAPRHGEVHGLGDGLWVWFGTDFTDAWQALLRARDPQPPEPGQAQVLRQAVALMVAHRRPAWYLFQGRDDLDQATDAHLRLLRGAGIISREWRDAALAERLRFRDMRANPPRPEAAPGKGTTAARTRLAGWLGVSLYQLDRFDAELGTTLHGPLQDAVDAYLARLTEPDFARAQGLMGERLLTEAGLDQVRYSFTLMERTPQGNRVRVQTDTSGQALDINEGSKLELGSTAKLRVLATYLEMVADLHARLAGDAVDRLGQPVDVEPRDTLTRWAVDHLATTTDPSLEPMLEAALERRFSANPDQNFFTGGGLHRFNNFNRSDDNRNPTLRESMQASINLPFVRLMREVVNHASVQMPGGSARLFDDARDPRRLEYLARFADREGQVFVRRFWRKTEGRTPDELRALLLEGLRPTPQRLVAVFRYLEPDASLDVLQGFVGARLGDAAPGRDTLRRLYDQLAPSAMDLTDRGHVAGVHPLELWVVGYRLQRPEATLAQALADSHGVRQQVYGWLFNTRARSAQDSRIQTMLEVEAFLDIHQRWVRHGYPFGQLVPSLATALGSSGDRPAALAELMGIIVNDGVRLPTRRLTDLRFASDTPWETALAQPPAQPEQVMPPEVARALRRVLAEVVEQGTARRLAGSFQTRDGQDLSPGGKTGTGDNRVVVQGRPVLSLNRTATFVFNLGDRYFGSLTAYVTGPDAARYRFTSGLPVQILRSMGPVLMPYLDPALEAGCPNGQ